MFNPRNRYFILTDLLFLALAVYLSYAMRLEGFDPAHYESGMLIFTAVVLVVIPFAFWQTKLYSRYWRYASINDLLMITGTVTLATLGASLLAFALAAWLPSQPSIPRSIPFIFLLLAITATAAPRLLVRILGQRVQSNGNGNGHHVPPKPVAIMGAGDAGVMIARELRQNPHLGMQVVAFLDDDPAKHGMHIHGIKVVGDRYAIPGLAHRQVITKVLLAMPTAPGKEIREIVAICKAVNLQTLIIPGVFELLDGTVSVNQLRKVQIEDLLRREPIQTDIAAVADLLHGKRVLVTGAGGSIGSELCRQILRCAPAQLALLGHGENSIFEIHAELSGLGIRDWGLGIGGLSSIRAYIADLRAPDRIHTILADFRPDVIFHAAAHKHVPLMEMNPAEAITNNVLGTRNLVQAAVAAGVQTLVMISTDKAVNPTSIMGASKRAAELVVHQAARRTGRNYVAVRFGNVLGSRGSVVLTFQKQIATGGPVTVTHPEMKRFFMTIPEAVQLVLQASVLGHGGEVFLLDMGEPVKIADLARDLITLSGLEVGKDIDIAFTGMRPGEKLFEELFVSGESYERTRHAKIFIAANASSFVPNGLDLTLARLDQAACANNKSAILHELCRLIPEFHPAGLSVVGLGRQSDPASAQSAPVLQLDGVAG